MRANSSDMSHIKEPNVSGQFYDADPQKLKEEIKQFFSQASVQPSDKAVEILVAPHAGYMYSGGVAAYSYKTASKKHYNTIIILAPSHYVPFDGISIWSEGGFQTPLGVVPVDQQFSQRLMDGDKRFMNFPAAFEREHSLEVELPFLQATFKDFKIVPVIVGQPSFDLLDKFARQLQKVIGDRDDVLIVVSTDMSHYHQGDDASKLDHEAIAAIKAMKPHEIYQKCRAGTMEMCGCLPIVAALNYAEAKGLTDVELLKYANSGDVTGDYNRVVGYSSIVIYKSNDQSKKNKDRLSANEKKELLALARNSIVEFVRNGKTLEASTDDPRLEKKEGAFVTITKNDQLRGCIGHIIGYQPLITTVRDVAISAASQDPRFPPLTEKELDDIEVEVSVLSEPQIIKNVDEIELGVHGVIVSRDPMHTGVFLPQVAVETQWSKEKFLNELCSQKAHLPFDCWKDPKTKLEIFTAQVFSEKDLH